tara:strand:- start:941 stop:1555 length:615 start_codon:yes stop_codon:yes gene_type:complete
MTGKIKLNAASGGGSVSLQAPSSSSNDRVISLPDIADGTLLTSESTGLGKVVNYAQTLKKDVTSASVAEGAISGALISLSYAAASSSNKLLLSYTIHIGLDTSVNCYGYLYIGGSVSSIIGDTGESNQKRATSTSQGVASHKAMIHSFQTLIDNPSTSSTTYDVRFGHGNNGTQNMYINRDASNGNYNYYARFVSSLTILEMAA